MLYQTLSQPRIFVLVCLTGFLCGFLFDFKNLLIAKIKKNMVLNIIFSFFATFFTLFSCFYVNLTANFGELRFFIILGFLLSFSIQRFLIKNFVATFLSKCYNNFKEKHHGKRKKEI